MNGGTKVKAGTLRYEVRFTITVDRPELRGPTFKAVEAGLKIPTMYGYANYSAAVRAYEACRKGEWDFYSEYVSLLEVVRVRTNGAVETVRRPMFRKRPIKVFHFEKPPAGATSYWSHYTTFKREERC